MRRMVALALLNSPASAVSRLCCPALSRQFRTKFVPDWGRAYAFTCFPAQTNGKNRSIIVGWTYEDDEGLVLARQRGYQGAFTLFRDLSLKVIQNVDPSFAGLNETGSWTTRIEPDGSTSVVRSNT
jgi:beta-fructofuranosidase